jgi:hypothetical protein
VEVGQAVVLQLAQVSDPLPLEPPLPPELELPDVPLAGHSKAHTGHALHPQVETACSSLRAVVPAVFSQVVTQAESVGAQVPRQLFSVTQLVSALQALACVAHVPDCELLKQVLQAVTSPELLEPPVEELELPVVVCVPQTEAHG